MPHRLLDLFDYLTGALAGAWPWLPAGAMIYLFGQATTGGLVDGFKLDFGSLSATAILGWYAWHNTTYTIPSIVKEFREELGIERKSNDETHRELRKQFFDELRESREFLRQLKHVPPPPDELR